jgi:MFS family permease
VAGRLTASAYLKLLRSPGVPRLAGSFLMMGVAGTMTPVVFVLFAKAATGSFATASLVLAASTAGGLIFGPSRGRLVDRIGARDAVLLLVVPDVLTDVGFILAGRAHATPILLLVLAFVAGAVSAPASAALRSAWSTLLKESDSRQAGFALMTVMQETNFIAGPLVAGAVIGVGSTTAAVATSAGLSFVGALAFGLGQPLGPRQPRPVAAGRFPALAGAGIRTVVATSTAFGLTFGILDVAFPAFARMHGSSAVAGVLLSGFAVGSWVGGFLYGLRPSTRSAGQRYPSLCLLAGVGLAPLILTPSLGLMVALAVLSGLCFAPITTCQIAAIDEVAQPGHKSEAFTWLGTLYGAGLAAGAAISGQLIAGIGVRAAMASACGATLLAWVFTTLRAATLRPVPDGAGHDTRISET